MSQATAQNTLDLLILKTLDRSPNHGFGITSHFRKASEGLLRIEEGSLYPAALHRLERQKLDPRAIGPSPRTAAARAFTL